MGQLIFFSLILNMAKIIIRKFILLYILKIGLIVRAVLGSEEN